MGGLLGTMVPPLRHGCKHLPGRISGRPTRPFPHTIPGANHARAGTNDTADVRQNIAALPSEERVFEPPAGFVAEALVRDRTIYERAEADYEGFWAEQADLLAWFKKWDTVMEWSPPWVKWFVGGTLNVSYNCLDRHVEAGGAPCVRVDRPNLCDPASVAPSAFGPKGLARRHPVYEPPGVRDATSCHAPRHSRYNALALDGREC